MIIHDRIQRRDCVDAIFAIHKEKKNTWISAIFFFFSFFERNISDLILTKLIERVREIKEFIWLYVRRQQQQSIIQVNPHVNLSIKINDEKEMVPTNFGWIFQLLRPSTSLTSHKFLSHWFPIICFQVGSGHACATFSW